jgi:hypothetical protein
LGILLALLLALNARWAAAKLVTWLRERRQQRRLRDAHDLRGLEEGLREALRVRRPPPEDTSRPPTPPPPPPPSVAASERPQFPPLCGLCLSGLRRLGNALTPRTVWAYPEAEEGEAFSLRRVKRGSGRKVTATFFRERPGEVAGEGQSFLGQGDPPVRVPEEEEEEEEEEQRQEVVRIERGVQVRMFRPPRCLIIDPAVNVFN